MSVVPWLHEVIVCNCVLEHNNNAYSGSGVLFVLKRFRFVFVAFRFYRFSERF